MAKQSETSNFPHPSHPNPESLYFPTWGDLLTFTRQSKGKGRGASARVDRENWAGVSSLESALNIAANGWPEGEEKAKALTASILDKITSLVEIEHVTYDVEGIGLDVATYLNGEPECWQRFEKEHSEGEGNKHVRIVYDATVSAGIDQDVITARGAAVAALIESLEFAGYRVQLEVLPLCHGDLWESRVLVKAADQDLDMSRVIYSLAHPSMLRYLGFACMDGCPKRSNASSSYGYGPIKPALDQGDIFISGAHLYQAQWTNPESATRWVLERLKAQGVALTEVE